MAATSEVELVESATIAPARIAPARIDGAARSRAVPLARALAKRLGLNLADIAGLNPIAQIIEDLRHALVLNDPVHIPWMGTIIGSLAIIPISITVAVLVIGFTVFHKLTPRFAESL